MATNKQYERLATFEIGVPQSGGANVAIASGAAVLYGNQNTNSHPMCGVAAEATTATPASAPYDANVPFFTVDFEGCYNLTVEATTQKSPSAGAAINPGDVVYYDGGTYDVSTGLTYGGVLDVDTGGVPFGRSMDALAAGQTGVLRIILSNKAV